MKHNPNPLTSTAKLQNLSGSTPSPAVGRSLAIVFGLTLCLVVTASAFAATGGSSTCYNCEIWSGEWECDTSSINGGTKCTLENGSCTVSGDCDSKGSATPFVAEVPVELIHEVARVDAGAAATLVRLRHMPEIPETARISWMSTQITAGDVASLLSGGEIASKTPHSLSRFDVLVELLDETSAALVIRPAANSDAQNFQEMAIFFEIDPATGETRAGDWFMR